MSTAFNLHLEMLFFFCEVMWLVGSSNVSQINEHYSFEPCLFFPRPHFFSSISLKCLILYISLIWYSVPDNIIYLFVIYLKLDKSFQSVSLKYIYASNVELRYLMLISVEIEAYLLTYLAWNEKIEEAVLVPSEWNSSSVFTTICHPTYCSAGSVAIVCFCKVRDCDWILLNQPNMITQHCWSSFSKVSVSIYLR